MSTLEGIEAPLKTFDEETRVIAFGSTADGWCWCFRYLAEKKKAAVFRMSPGGAIRNLKKMSGLNGSVVAAGTDGADLLLLCVDRDKTGRGLWRVTDSAVKLADDASGIHFDDNGDHRAFLIGVDGDRYVVRQRRIYGPLTEALADFALGLPHILKCENKNTLVGVKESDGSLDVVRATVANDTVDQVKLATIPAINATAFPCVDDALNNLYYLDWSGDGPALFVRALSDNTPSSSKKLSAFGCDQLTGLVLHGTTLFLSGDGIAYDDPDADHDDDYDDHSCHGVSFIYVTEAESESQQQSNDQPINKKPRLSE